MAVGGRPRVAATLRARPRGAVGNWLVWPRGGFVLLGAGAIAAVAATHLIDYGVYHLEYEALNANLAVELVAQGRRGRAWRGRGRLARRRPALD